MIKLIKMQMIGENARVSMEQLNERAYWIEAQHYSRNPALGLQTGEWLVSYCKRRSNIADAEEAFAELVEAEQKYAEGGER